MHEPSCVGDVFVHLGFQMSMHDVGRVVNCEVGAIEELLLFIRFQVKTSRCACAVLARSAAPRSTPRGNELLM